MKHTLLTFRLEDITALRQALIRGEIVKVKHLGVFSTYRIPARTYRLPKSLEMMQSKPRIKPKFRPTRSLTQFLQAREK